MSNFITLDKEELKFNPKLFGFGWNYFGFWDHETRDIQIAIDDEYSPAPIYTIFHNRQEIFNDVIPTHRRAVEIFEKIELKTLDPTNGN